MTTWKSVSCIFNKANFNYRYLHLKTYNLIHSDCKPEWNVVALWPVNQERGLEKVPLCPRRCWRGCCRPRTGCRASRPSPATWRRWRSSSTRMRSVHPNFSSFYNQTPDSFFFFPWNKKNLKWLFYIQGNEDVLNHTAILSLRALNLYLKSDTYMVHWRIYHKSFICSSDLKTAQKSFSPP